MKMKLVRKYLLEQKAGVSEKLFDRVVIIDGLFLKGTYKLSGCHFILGGEYDRYANYLRNFIDKFRYVGISCYVVFNGAMPANKEIRKEIHQNIINRTHAIQPGRPDNEYCEPIFVKDVQREIFEELNVNYFVCEYEHREALITLARKYNYPIFTNNFEYCLYGVSCILPSSVVFDKDNGFRCTIYKRIKPLQLRSDLMSVLLAISDEDAIYYRHLPSVLKCHINNVFKAALYWIRRENHSSAVQYLTKYFTAEEKAALLSEISSTRQILNSNQHIILRSYSNCANIVEGPIDVKENGWFRDGVASGQIAIPYINLKNENTFSGSWLITDIDKNDAMLVALDIVFYVMGIMSNSKEVSLSFIGRQFDKSHISYLDFQLKSNRVLKLFHREKKKIVNDSEDVFKVVIDELLCGFDFQLLKDLSKECHLLIIALVYYCAKTKQDFKSGVYSILLSYLMLGLISNEVGLLKKSNFLVTHNNNKDEESGSDNGKKYIIVARAFIDFFYLDESSLKNSFFRDILHRLAEFEHCLQHVNYLNKLCGEKTERTTFYKTINSTFIYNVFITLKDKESPLNYLRQRMNCNSVFQEYYSLVEVFDKCFKSVVVDDD